MKARFHPRQALWLRGFIRCTERRTWDAGMRGPADLESWDVGSRRTWDAGCGDAGGELFAQVVIGEPTCRDTGSSSPTALRKTGGTASSGIVSCHRITAARSRKEAHADRP